MPDDTYRDIVRNPGYLTATVKTVNGRTALVEHRAVTVKTSGGLYQPVREFLATHCYAVLSSETSPDPEMRFGRSVLTVRQVWEVCPGDRPHVCVAVPGPREESSGRTETSDLPVREPG